MSESELILNQKHEDVVFPRMAVPIPYFSNMNAIGHSPFSLIALDDLPTRPLVFIEEFKK